MAMGNGERQSMEVVTGVEVNSEAVTGTDIEVRQGWRITCQMG